MPGPYITDAELKQAVADVIGLDLANMPARWNRIVTQANIAGYRDMVQAIQGLGMLPAQVDGWDDRKNLNMQQGLFWALTMGAGITGFDKETIKLFDQREMIKERSITISGLQAAPAAQTEGSESPVTGGLLPGNFTVDLDKAFQ